MNRKVLFNTWTGAFFNPGGGEVQLLQTRLHLQKAGAQVSLFDLWKPQHDFEIFHQFSIQAGVEYPMREYRQLGKKIALSPILWTDFLQKDAFYYRIRELFELSDILLTNSDAESKKLAHDFELDLRKFHKTRNGISEDFLDTCTDKDFRTQFKLPDEFILSVANIDRRKNTLSLIQACAEIGKTLVLIGHIRDPIYFQECRNKNSDFLFLGPITDVSVLKSAFQQCSIYALPSLCETPGIAALEAASQGAKVVITREGPTEEYFGNLVTYVDPLDLTSIRDGINKELKATRNKDQLISHIVSHYTWDKTAEDVLNGYQKILTL